MSAKQQRHTGGMECKMVGCDCARFDNPTVHAIARHREARGQESDFDREEREALGNDGEDN